MNGERCAAIHAGTKAQVNAHTHTSLNYTTWYKGALTTGGGCRGGFVVFCFLFFTFHFADCRLQRNHLYPPPLQLFAIHGKRDGHHGIGGGGCRGDFRVICHLSFALKFALCMGQSAVFGYCPFPLLSAVVGGGGVGAESTAFRISHRRQSILKMAYLGCFGFRILRNGVYVL